MWYKYKNIEFTDFSASSANISYTTWLVISYARYAFFFTGTVVLSGRNWKEYCRYHLENKIQLLKQRIVWMFLHVWENVISVEERKNTKSASVYVTREGERERICYSITIVYKCWTSNVFLLLLPRIVYDFIHNVYAYKCVIIRVIYILYIKVALIESKSNVTCFLYIYYKYI